VKKSLACVFAISGFIASAQAADLDIGSMKDPLPDTLTWHGVTIYGTIDAGYAYQTNGRPLGGIVSDLEYIPFNNTRNYTGQPISTLQGSGLEQSKIGVKIEEDIGLGLTAAGRLETGFDPMTGMLSDGCASLVQNVGVKVYQQTSNGDTSRCGQAFNSMAYAGLSSPSYGTLTVGRQNSLQLDAIATYDPMALSYAFSLLGVNGQDGGSGSTQAGRWDESVKYVYTYGPVHAAAMYSNGGPASGTLGSDYGFNIGGNYRGFSIDAVYTKEHDAVNIKNSDSYTNGTATIPAGDLDALMSNNTAWSVMGKYVYDFGGGFKDDGPAAKLTIFAGYTHIDQANPGNSVASSFTNGGYAYVADNNAFTTNKNLDYYWTGAKYALPSGWSFTGAYYHVDQNSYIADNTACTKGGASLSQCAGTYDQFSFLVDYAFNKHFDVYGGVTYGRVANGLAANFQGTSSANDGGTPGTATSIDTTDFVTGLRLRF
jgi:predicted porin